MTDEDTAHTQCKAQFHENDQKGYRQNDFRHDDGDVQHIIDQFFTSEFIFLQTEGAYGANENRDDSTQDSNDDGIPQAVDQRRVGKEFSIPLCGKAIPVVVISLVIEGECHHNCNRNIQDRIHQECVNVADDTIVSFFFRFSG